LAAQLTPDPPQEKSLMSTHLVLGLVLAPMLALQTPSEPKAALFVNNPLMIPGHTGANNVQFFGANGQSWAFGVTGPAPGPLNVTGTRTWTVAAVPFPAAIWLFGSGAELLAIRTWRGYSPS